MVVRKILSANDTMHVGLHQFLATLETIEYENPQGTYLDQVDFCETLVVPWLLDVKNGDDVFVVEITKQFHFAKSSQAKHGMIERCDLLDSNLLLRRLVNSRA